MVREDAELLNFFLNLRFVLCPSTRPALEKPQLATEWSLYLVFGWTIPQISIRSLDVL